MHIKLLIGLGNPETTYKDTYHNIGFAFVDFLSNRKETDHFPSLGHISVEKMRGFMNDAGRDVQDILNKHHVTGAETVLVHDDSDIALGSFKLSLGRSSAGHKGVQDIIVKNGAEFWRLRIGIRASSNSEKAGEFVLRKISATEKEVFARVFEAAALSLERLIAPQEKN